MKLVWRILQQFYINAYHKIKNLDKAETYMFYITSSEHYIFNYMSNVMHLISSFLILKVIMKVILSLEII